MAILVDTSALYALLAESDDAHGSASTFFRQTDPVDLVTHNYVVLESIALVQPRMGRAAVRDLLTGLLPAFATIFVDADVHEAAVGAHLAGGGRSASFVDRVSFELMRRDGIDTAFTFDRDFRRAGFRVVP